VSVSGATVQCTTAGLSALTWYQATADTTLASVSGQHLASDFNWKFETGVI
jgi:hypothetical protein